MLTLYFRPSNSIPWLTCQKSWKINVLVVHFVSQFVQSLIAFKWSSERIPTSQNVVSHQRIFLPWLKNFRKFQKFSKILSLNTLNQGIKLLLDFLKWCYNFLPVPVRSNLDWIILTRDPLIEMILFWVHFTYFNQ